MSRFFATGGSDSESESSEEEVPAQTFGKLAPTYTFSDEEEEVKRVVRSTKEKRYEDLSNVIKNIRNYKKIKDMSSILTSFEDLTRAYTKALPVISKEENGITPRFYVRCLAELEDFISEVWEDRDGRKNLSKNNYKSLGTLRQKVRKYIKDFEEDLIKFREAPDVESEAEEEKPESESESEEENVAPQKAVQFKKEVEKVPKVPKDDDSDDSIDWGSDSQTESESSDDENQYQSMRERFLKRATDKDDKDDETVREKKKDKKLKEVKNRRKREEDDEEGEWETVTKGSTTEKPKMFAKDAEIDVPLVLNKLIEIMSARGKKRTDRRMQIEFLYELKQISDQHKLGLAVTVKIYFSIVTAIFDYNPKVSEPMKLEYWTKLIQVMQDMLQILLTSQDITMCFNVSEEQEEYKKSPFFIRGCALAAVEKLDDEFTKLLKECDPHSNDYVDR